MKPQFEIVDLGSGCRAIDDHGRTVATLSSQGFIDWLLRSTDSPGPAIRKIYKETHMTYTLGLKIQMAPLSPAFALETLTAKVTKAGAGVILRSTGHTSDGALCEKTSATLEVDEHGDYVWSLENEITNESDETVSLPGGIEFNNVYPNSTGRCMLCTPTKKYDSTFMKDSVGQAWLFPHQHTMHYTPKISRLNFAAGTVAGFLGEPDGSPVVLVRECTLEPDWAICDMYYDLHCLARAPVAFAPGQTAAYRYDVRYLRPEQVRDLTAEAKPVGVDQADRDRHNFPRLELGRNALNRIGDIDRYDDASIFVTSPPQRVWDKEIGHAQRGSLRITNDIQEQTVWPASPPTEIPAQNTLSIVAKIKTEGVTGKGAYLRVQYHTYEWHPEPHVVWARDLESEAVTGTTDGWKQVMVPALHVPASEPDYLVAIQVILEGAGVAWFTDIDIDLLHDIVLEPSISEAKQLTRV